MGKYVEGKYTPPTQKTDLCDDDMNVAVCLLHFWPRAQVSCAECTPAKSERCLMVRTWQDGVG
jgi:hypothetical protein